MLPREEDAIDPTAPAPIAANVGETFEHHRSHIKEGKFRDIRMFTSVPTAMRMSKVYSDVQD